MEYIEIKEQIKQKLPVARDLGDSENLLELGLSSLTIMRLVNQWRKQGVKVSFGSLMENPTLEGWWALIQRSMKKKAGKKRAQESKITPEKDMKQPFPLTDVQYAYWVGRDEEQALGGIDCHAYLEFDGGNIDPERLEKAWNVLQYHHPMLRACFLDDGTQKILDKPYCEKIKVHDFSRMSSEEAEAMAVSVRERLSHRKLKIEEGEVAGIELTLFPENKARLHVDMALLVADVQSLQILLRDLASAYRGENLPKESKGWNFASYLERQKQEEGEERKNAEKYWKNRLEHLPKGPDLPLAKRPQEVEKTVFNRRIVRIEKEEWDHLQMWAKKYQTTPAMVLLTAYAVVLERWSRNHCFLINIPFFNRKTEQQGLEEVIADFTTLLLLEINCEENPTFAELLDRIQKQLHEDMKYTAYSGVQVQRDIAQMCGDASAVAPVVFACNLGTPLVNDTFRNELGQFSYMISQTPQVWNDFQSYEDENGVQLTWDSVDELFPENMIPDMLESFEILLHELGKKDWNQRFDVLPEKRKREIEDTARTGVPERVECLHWAVMNHAEVCPEDIALIDAGSGRSVSYGELKARATAVAAGISEKDIKGVPVALTLPRGIEQIESALGILLSGNSYLPVSLSQPKDRRALIHEKTGVRYVVTNRELSEKLDWPEGTEILVMEGMEEGQENVRMPEVSPKDSAYIIMTSGSTGVPKGVEIAHESAWNTVQDINEKYHVTSADRALAVSAMDFDLSVYDVFGILGAGGTLVLLPEQERRNADYWLEQVLKYQITVWNSVPVLLDMLLIRAESMKQKLPIRAVMLSGDWIGMDLPQRVAAWTEDCQFVAMGGATEASIWSNYQNVTLPMPKNWKSIPYGKPLRYQAYRVVDEYGRDCPYWAEGELWIGGFGVAKGYRGDSALTGQKFITDQYGRWYRTGDLGRIWDDEIIEFLGRKDHQVKIRGHRIELGEIEHAIQEFPGVAHAVVDTVSDGHGNKTLAAYIGAPIQEDSKVTTYLYGTDIFGGGWKELKDDVSNWQMQQERKTAYKNFLAYADQRCVQLMLETLIELGIFVSEKEVLSQKEIFEKGSITETQKNTVARWLEILKKEGILREEDGRLSRTGKEVAVPEKAGDAETYFKKLKPYLKHMVTGNEVPLDVFYQKEPALAPNMLLRRIPGCEETVERLVQGLRLLAEERRKEPLQIIEIGTRDTAITRQFLNALEDVSVAYTYADSSKYFLQEAEKELAGYERVEFEMLNLEEGMDKQQMSLHSYDVVISVNALHRNIDAADAVKKVAELLKPNGILLMTDLVVRTYLQELTAAFLENGFADIRDKRKEAGLVTPDCLLWRECLSEAGLGEDCAVTERYGRCICCSRQQASVLSYHNGALREYLSEKLPEYMVPQNYHFMEQLPTLSNGKINRKQLREDFKEETAVIRFSKATTETEEKLLDIWKQLFGYENIGIEDNYFSLGGDSLIATRLISEVQTTFGCKITISTIFENLTVKSLAKAIEQSEQKEEDTLQIKPNLEEAYHSFPLTDVQYAYWLGRSGLYELGNVATHCYFELDADGLDTECAETAWNLLIQRHGMMRVIIQPDGMQRILENTPQYHIDVTDIRQLEVTEKEKALDEKRAEMSHQVIQTDEWPLFDVRITKIEDQKHRIHISFDNIIFDGWSMFHLLDEWAEVYRNGKAEMSITLSFRDYVLGLEQIKSTSAYEKDKKYWEDRVETFADAPDLPLAKNESQITEQRFCRRSAKLSQKEWQSVKDAAGRLEVTPSVLLMSAYAETLRLWSSNKDFTLNLTQFDRKQLHPEVNNLVGDFTTLTLLEIKNAGNNFAERTKAIQKQLTEDLEHTAYSAVELERELKKKTGNMRGAIMPVVFTSGLGVEQWNEGKWLGKLNYNISQTPQVWLDHQVVEMDGSLCLFWDSVDELFYPGMLDEMFRAYTGLLHTLAVHPEIMQEKTASLVTAKISEKRRQANETAVEFEEKTLDRLFLEAVDRFPDKEALVTGSRRMTYREIKEEAFYISEQLRSMGIKKQETVAVFMEKGWEQVVAVYGILFAGAAYLPIDIHNPKERVEKILRDSGTRIILVQNQADDHDAEWLRKWNCVSLSGLKNETEIKMQENKPEDLAYVIYTSGTTGMPKGVMISHHNAVNTILDINDRYQITEQDTAFGISNLHFDLSVYDVFGILGAGGKLVLPDPEYGKDPAHWIHWLNHENITLWNSVPAFVEMLAEYEEYQRQVTSQSLRLVMMSGDWVPVSLPGRIRNLFQNVEIVALGGATEGSIWSNHFEIPEVVPEDWKSIPYGKPLANQKYYVLDQNMEDCPDWVPGTLYIAGDGIAQGYLNDKEKTKEKFVVLDRTGERLYCTGDMGRYWNDGNIEFLGRLDNQVKIGGHRIELGELENALNSIPQIKESIVEVINKKYLIAFICFDKMKYVKIDEDIFWENGINELKKEFVKNEEEIFINSYGKSLEKISAMIIFQTFIEMGVKENCEYTSREFAELLNVNLEFQNLVKKWIDILIDEGMMVKTNLGVIICRRDEFEYDLYREMQECQEKERVLKLYKELKENIPATITILRNKYADVEIISKGEFKALPVVLEEISPLDKTMKDVLFSLYKMSLQITGTDSSVLEIGSRMRSNTKRYMDVLGNGGEFYYLDESSEYIDKALEIAGDVNRLKSITYDFKEPYLYIGELRHKMDIIVADNTLHRSYDIELTLSNFKEMLKSGGILLFKEYTIPNRLILNSVALLEKGFSMIQDLRKGTCMPLLSVDKWKELLKNAGFDNIMSFRLTAENAKCGTGETIFIARNHEEVNFISEAEIIERLKNIVPEYMIPKRIYEVVKIPLSANGKVNRNKLLNSIKQTDFDEKDEKQAEINMTNFEKSVASVWQTILEKDILDKDSNFFQNGGDSLKAIRLVNALKEELGIEPKISWLFEAPTISEFVARIQQEMDSNNYMEDDGEI